MKNISNIEGILFNGFVCTFLFLLLGAPAVFAGLEELVSERGNPNEKALLRTAAVCERHEVHIVADVLPFCQSENNSGEEGTMLITEVLYDLKNDGSQGSERGGDNEWVEIHNPTAEAIDVMGWTIGVSSTTGDIISESSLVIEPGEFLVITDSETTADFWDFSDTAVVYLNSSISGGLRNTGDHVSLFDGEGEHVDGVSWGDDISAFDPSVIGGEDGTSIGRSDTSVDTDTAGDWEIMITPTPGS